MPNPEVISFEEARQDLYEIDLDPIFEDPNQMLDFLGKGWQTDNLGMSEREFKTRYEKGQGELRFVFFRDRDTRAIELVASMTGAHGKGRSRVSLPNITKVIVYPGPSGFKGMISVRSEDQTIMNIRTQPLFREISMTTAGGGRTDIKL